MAKGILMYFSEEDDEIKLIARDILFADDIAMINWAKNTLYYVSSNEVHMVCVSTLEDEIIAKDFGSNLQIKQGFSDYLIYLDENMKSHIVAGYFDENNKAIKSKKSTMQMVK